LLVHLLFKDAESFLNSFRRHCVIDKALGNLVEVYDKIVDTIDVIRPIIFLGLKVNHEILVALLGS
jgi:hypothetical protein